MARGTVYQLIKNTIFAAGPDLTAQGFTPIKRIAIYNRDYQEDDQKQPLPPRPTLFVEFGTTDWRNEAGKKRGIMPVILHLVQDCFVEGRSGNAGEDKYMELLEYPGALASLLDNLGALGQGWLRHKRSEPDHSHGNLLVDRLHFEVDIKG